MDDFYFYFQVNLSEFCYFFVDYALNKSSLTTKKKKSNYFCYHLKNKQVKFPFYNNSFKIFSVLLFFSDL